MNTKTRLMLVTLVGALWMSVFAADSTNSLGTNTVVTANAKAQKVAGFPVPPTLSSVYYKVDGEWIPAAPNEKDLLIRDEDVPQATNKRMSFALNTANFYQVSITFTRSTGVVETTYFGTETGVSDKTPNMMRNEFSGQFPVYTVTLVPPPAVPPK